MQSFIPVVVVVVLLLLQDMLKKNAIDIVAGIGVVLCRFCMCFASQFVAVVDILVLLQWQLVVSLSQTRT